MGAPDNIKKEWHFEYRGSGLALVASCQAQGSFPLLKKAFHLRDSVSSYVLWTRHEKVALVPRRLVFLPCNDQLPVFCTQPLASHFTESSSVCDVD